MKNRIKYILQHYVFIQTVYKFVFSLFFRFLGLFVKTDDKLILFSSFGGKKFNDSPRVLYENMIKNELFKGYKFVWAFENPKMFPLKKEEKVKIDTFKYFIIALKAKIWISSVNIERGLHFKKRKTIYINTWHGTGPKYSGNKVSGRKDYNFTNVDIVCCDGLYLKQIMVNDHGALEKNCFITGRPREDWLFQYTKEDVNAIKNQLGISGKNVILFAPTWRDSTDFGKSSSYDFPINIDYWKKKLGDNFVVLFRGHPLTESINGGVFDDFFINVSSYDDINHLYIVSDYLISDYSSVFFDFGQLKKPMFCFAFDYNDYITKRGLYIDLKREFPGGVYVDEKPLLDAMLNIDEHLLKETEIFINKYVQRPNNATEKVLSILIKKLSSAK